MLDCLRRCEKSRVESRRALELLHDFLPLLDDAHDGIAGLAARRLVNLFEHFLEPCNMLLGLALMLFESGLQPLRLGGFCHLGKGAQDFLLRKVDVLESFVKEFVKILFAGHRHYLLDAAERNRRRNIWFRMSPERPRRRLPFYSWTKVLGLPVPEALGRGLL